MLSVGLLTLMILALAGCGGMNLPFALPFGQPTATFTPTPTNTPTPTPETTATLRPGETPAAAPATPIATPQVTIPEGWNPVRDERLGYSFAIPGGWSELDLRGGQIANMANMVGQGETLRQLQNFLATEEGQNIGIVALELDMMGLMRGRIPPLLNVSVIPLPPGADSAYLMSLVDANMGMLDQFGDVQVESVNTDVVNNLQAIRATARADLSQAGLPTTLFVKAVGLVANDQLYLMTLAVRDEIATEKDPQFDQIIGTFRPE
jgi:hypothetical protein